MDWLQGGAMAVVLPMENRPKQEEEEESSSVGGGVEDVSKEMVGREEEGEEALENPSGGPIGSGSSLPSWKLYDNPFYYDHHHHHHHHHHRPHQPSFATKRQCYNHDQLPPSARKLAASLWVDVFRPMDATSELHLARARVRELKAELDFERRLRKKADALSRALAREAAEERARREAEERAREGLEAELARAREEAAELRRAVEEERRMMRVAEAMREERVHMKLAEARLLMEEKLLQMRSSSTLGVEEASAGTKGMAGEACARWAGEGGGEWEGGGGASPLRRKEAENPHIRRGIKGFVEFPKVGRARGGWGSCPKEGIMDPGPKLECQMAQLRVLLKHRVSVGPGPVNLIV